MSHNPERKIKVCLNCGTNVHGRFCHVCGQENIEPKESFAGLVNHFFSDITHFDGKFFSSIKYLFTRPGFISMEYVKGRRASYLHPVRMYIFTSFIFFLIFFSVFHLDEKVKSGNIKVKTGSAKDISEKNRETLNSVLRGIDSETISKSDRAQIDKDLDETGFNSKALSSRQYYDSVQNLLPAKSKDNWLVRQMHYKMIENRQSENTSEQVFWRRVLNKFFHYLPQLLFVSLPLYALLLKLIYFRRKDLYYADHAIYAIHIFVFRFLVILAVILLNQLQHYTHWGWLQLLQIPLYIYLFGYSIYALKRFYQQSTGKTLLKSFILFQLNSFVVITLFALFLVLSFFQL